MSCLPSEIWEMILGQLSQEEWRHWRGVCRVWDRVIRNLPFYFSGHSLFCLKIFRVVALTVDRRLSSEDLPADLLILDGQREFTDKRLSYPISLVDLRYPYTDIPLSSFTNLTRLSGVSDWSNFREKPKSSSSSESDSEYEGWREPTGWQPHELEEDLHSELERNLVGLTKLRYLEMPETEWGSEFGLTTLSHLEVLTNISSDLEIPHLSLLTNLRRLEFNSHLTEEEMQTLSTLPHLTKLVFESEETADMDFSPLLQCTNLRSLYGADTLVELSPNLEVWDPWDPHQVKVPISRLRTLQSYAYGTDPEEWLIKNESLSE